MSSRLEDVIQRGVAAARPAAATVPVGTLYYSTDTEVLERSTGTAWESYSGAAGGGGGSGDVVGPSSATNNALALFDGTTGKLLKDSATLLSSLAPFDHAADHTVTGDWIFKNDDTAATHSSIKVVGPTNLALVNLAVGPTSNPSLIADITAQGVNDRWSWYNKVEIDSTTLGLTIIGTGVIGFNNNSAYIRSTQNGLLRVGSGNPINNVGANVQLGELASNLAKPTASAAVRGTLWITWGTAGVADVIEVCLKDAADAYAWHPITFT